MTYSNVLTGSHSKKEVMENYVLRYIKMFFNFIKMFFSLYNIQYSYLFINAL